MYRYKCHNKDCEFIFFATQNLNLCCPKCKTERTESGIANSKVQEPIISYIESLESGAKMSSRMLSEMFDVSFMTAHRAMKNAANKGLIKMEPNVRTVRI